MRKMALKMVYELAKKDKRIFFIGSDLGFKTLKEFQEEMPDRFFVEGVAEANVVGMSAGLALNGKIVYANTIATFLTRRCFEQVVLDLGLHNANVRLIGNGGGLVYAPLGPTHLAIDDIAILRAIPNMTILVPADAEEMRRLMPLTVDHQGPIYIRLAKGHDPVVSKEEPIEIGKAVVAQEGKEAVIITTGITLQIALEASKLLLEKKVKPTILHMHTVKPLDRSALLKYASPATAVVTIEEHTLCGGLGSAVAEIVAEANFNPGKRFKRIGIPDVFSKEYGSQASQLKSFGISAENLAATVQDLLNV
jgi:transketolase